MVTVLAVVIVLQFVIGGFEMCHSYFVKLFFLLHNLEKETTPKWMAQEGKWFGFSLNVFKDIQ